MKTILQNKVTGEMIELILTRVASNWYRDTNGRFYSNMEYRSLNPLTWAFWIKCELRYLFTGR